MAMGKKGDEQVDLFVPYHQMRSAGHPFYQALEKISRRASNQPGSRRSCSPRERNDFHHGLPV
jgi:hypothetical protein